MIEYTTAILHLSESIPLALQKQIQTQRVWLNICVKPSTCINRESEKLSAEFIKKYFVFEDLFIETYITDPYGHYANLMLKTFYNKTV